MGKLQECAVVAIPTDNFGGWMICCAYVVRAGDDVSLGDLREHLKKLVPNYMFPARWMAFEALPKNPNGKIDRPLLKERFLQNEGDSATIAAPTGGVEPSQEPPSTPPKRLASQV
jgi:acyl-coenzyme A synthetase/AMP-(fatty) acid ligase